MTNSSHGKNWEMTAHSEDPPNDTSHAWADRLFETWIPVSLWTLSVLMLQKHMRFAVDRFASSTSTLDWA
jgi:hypothetical protein